MPAEPAPVPARRTLIVGPGYLGGRVADRLVARGDAVFGTTRSPDRAGGLAGRGIEPVVFDVTDPGAAASLPEVDRVLHCVGFDRKSGRSIGEVYVDGLRPMLDYYAGRIATFVYASSTGVYGDGGGDWVDEETPPDPRTESGRACLDAENLVRAWAAGGGGEAFVLRFAGLYGPGRIIRRDAIARGEPVAGDPDRFLNLIQIDDAATASIAALDQGGPPGVYTVADDRPAPRSEFYALVARAIGAPEPRYVAPEPGSPESRREGSNKRVSNRRMRSVLGVELAYPDIISGVPASLGEG